MLDTADKIVIKDIVTEIVSEVFGKFTIIVSNGFTRIDKQFEDVYRRFDIIDERFKEIDARFKEIYARFDEIDNRFIDIYERFDGIEYTLSGLRSQISGIHGRIDSHVIDYVSQDQYIGLNKRVAKIEKVAMI